MAEKNTQQQRLLRCTLFALFFNGVASQLLGAFIPYLRQTYGFTYDFSGVLLSCQSIGSLAAILLSGVLPVYLGCRRSILALAVWMAVGFGLIAARVGTPFLLAACVMIGIARGANTNFCNTMTSTLPGEQATCGYHLGHGFFAVGALLSPLAFLLCMRLFPQDGWRYMAIGLSGLVVVQLLVYGKMPMPPEQDTKRMQMADLSFLKNRRFWLGAVMLFFYFSMEYAVVGWMVTYFQDTGILSAAQSQSMNSLLWGVIFIGRMLGASCTGRISHNTLLVIDGIGTLAFFLVMFFGRSPLPAVVGLAGVGLFMATIYPSAYAIGSECVRGNDFGCSILSLAGSLGGVLTPMLVGVVADTYDIRAGMGVVLGCTALLLTSILVTVREAARDN